MDVAINGRQIGRAVVGAAKMNMRRSGDQFIEVVKDRFGRAASNYYFNLTGSASRQRTQHVQTSATANDPEPSNTPRRPRERSLSNWLAEFIEHEHFVFDETYWRPKAAGNEIIMDECGRARKQQVHLSPEPGLERSQQTPLEALGQKHAVDIEAFVHDRRCGSVKLPRANCECKHLEVAGEDHVGAAHMLSDAAQPGQSYSDR